VKWLFETGGKNRRRVKRMKNSVDFQAFAPRTPKMRLFFTPKTLALASGLALAAAVWPGQAWAQPAGKLSTAITVSQQISVQQVRGQNSNNSWMIVPVEITAQSNPDPRAINPQWVRDVSVTLTLGWGTTGTPPQLDRAGAATAKLVALQVNTATVVMFFVPPEFLQAGSSNPDGLSASSKPTYYVAQITAGGVPMNAGMNAVSSTLPNQNYIDGFLKASGTQTAKNAGMMLTSTSVPPSVLQGAMQYTNGDVVPTLMSPPPSGT
jgi:hypothetical protein